MTDIMSRLARCDAIPLAWRGWDVDACEKPVLLRAFAADLVGEIEHYHMTAFTAEQEREAAVGLAEHDEVELGAERAKRCATCRKSDHRADCPVEYNRCATNPDGNTPLSFGCTEHEPRP